MTSIESAAAWHLDKILETSDFRAFRQGCPDHEARRLALKMIAFAFKAGAKHRAYSKVEPEPDPELHVEPSRYRSKTAAEIAAAGPVPAHFGSRPTVKWDGAAEEDEL